MATSTRLVLVGLGLTTGYAALIAWYTLGLDAWQGHRLYPEASWERPTSTSHAAQ